ncbi:MAG TPA: DNA repair protein, partial [Blastocatellia bacterium]
FTVELIKRKYNITNEITKMTFLERFENIFTKDKKKERAISYLRKWGDKFWEPTEYRIKEITGKIEDELRTSIGTKLSPVELNASAASKLTAEQKIEVVQRGQEVIVVD